MTEHQYTTNRIIDILRNLSQSNLSPDYRRNQENALKFYVKEINSTINFDT